MSPARARQRIIELNEALATNPVRELVEAGMFQTLVEDIGVDEDPYSYKSKLTDWVDSKTGADSTRKGVQAVRTGAPAVTLKSPTCGRVKIPHLQRQEQVDC